MSRNPKMNGLYAGTVRYAAAVALSIAIVVGVEHGVTPHQLGSILTSHMCLVVNLVYY